MRSVYLDESGISANESIVVVAGVVVDADRQWLALRQYIDGLIKDYVPPEHQDGIVFHATDLFHGSGPVFGRHIYPAERAHEVLRHLLKAPEIFDLPVVFGHLQKRIPPEGLSRKELRAEKARNHAVAFSLCATAAEKYMRQYSDPNEIATLTVENNTETQQAVRNIMGILRGQNLDSGGAREFFNLVANTAEDCLPITRIVDSVNFQFKNDAILLQLADACAFAIRRYFEGKPTSEKFFSALAGRDFTKFLGDKNSHASCQMFAWTPKKADNASVPEKDANKEALDQVEQATESKPVKGEDLLESEEAKRQLREAKERLKSESP